LECGVPATDPAIVKAAHFVRQQVPSLKTTYEISLAILLLDRLTEPADRELIRSLALRLVAGQQPRGNWGYNCPILEVSQERPLLQALEQRQAELRRLAVPGQSAQLKKPPGVPHPGWGNVTLHGQSEGDNSNTQFALLALWAVGRDALPLG